MFLIINITIFSKHNTVHLNGTKNAGILSLQIVSAANSEVRRKIINYMKGIKKNIFYKSKNLRKTDNYKIIPIL